MTARCERCGHRDTCRVHMIAGSSVIACVDLAVCKARVRRAIPRLK